MVFGAVSGTKDGHLPQNRADVLANAWASPSPKRDPVETQKQKHKFNWPIPPTLRAGTPRGIVNDGVFVPSGKCSQKVVNGPESLNIAGDWQQTVAHPLPTPFKRFHCPSPVVSRLPLSSRGQPSTAWEDDGVQITLLAALGMAPLSSTGEGPAGQQRYLAANKLRDPQECEDGCYWRWLTHSLLEDVASLKKNLEETQEAHRELLQKKQFIEEKIHNHARLTSELGSMNKSLKTLRQDVPQRRQEYERIAKESEQLEKRRRELNEEKARIEVARTRTTSWTKANTRKVLEKEREAEDGRRQEKGIGDKIHMDRESLQQTGQELARLTLAMQEVQEEVRAIEEKKAMKKAKKKDKAAKK